MSASAAAVAAAQKALGCKQKWPGKPWSMCWNGHLPDTTWTDRGCPVAVAVADAVAVIAARDALLDAAEDIRARKTAANANVGPNGRQLERRAIAHMLRARAHLLSVERARLNP